MTEPNDNFFNRQFWRMTLIAAFSQMIVLVIALTASLVIGGKIDAITNMFATMNETMTRVESSINTVMGIDPAALQERADALRDSATEVGVGVGDGGAETVNRVGDAINNWRNNRQDETDNE
jgi:hypothetical protein